MEVRTEEYWIVDLLYSEEIPLVLRTKFLFRFGETWFACGLLYIADEYSAHFDSFIVSCEAANDEHYVLPLTELMGIRPCITCEIRGKLHVSVPYRLLKTSV